MYFTFLVLWILTIGIIRESFSCTPGCPKRGVSHWPNCQWIPDSAWECRKKCGNKNLDCFVSTTNEPKACFTPPNPNNSPIRIEFCKYQCKKGYWNSKEFITFNRLIDCFLDCYYENPTSPNLRKEIMIGGLYLKLQKLCLKLICIINWLFS